MELEVLKPLMLSVISYMQLAIWTMSLNPEIQLTTTAHSFKVSRVRAS